MTFETETEGKINRDDSEQGHDLQEKKRNRDLLIDVNKAGKSWRSGGTRAGWEWAMKSCSWKKKKFAFPAGFG